MFGNWNLMIESIKKYLPLFLLLVAGALLRWYQIGFQCMWTDEQYTLTMSKLPLLQLLSQHSTDYNTPIYYLFTKASLLLFNTNLSIRYPSFVVGVALVLMAYLLGREYQNHNTGIYCAVIATFLYPYVYYSDFARAYMMSVLLFCIVLIYYFRIKRCGWMHNWVQFGLISGFTILIHQFTVIPIALLYIDLIWNTDIDEYKDWCSAVIPVVMYLPFVPTLLKIVSSRTSLAPNTLSDWAMPRDQLAQQIPLEFWNVLWPVFAIICWYEFYKPSLDYSRVLITVTVLTIVAEIGASYLTAVFPRYGLCVSVIPILISCAWFEKRYGLDYCIVFIGIMAMLFLQGSSFLVHWHVQQYVC